jgi:RHS repeat-associated protein
MKNAFLGTDRRRRHTVSALFLFTNPCRAAQQALRDGLISRFVSRQIWLRKSAAVMLMLAMLVQVFAPAVAYANYQPTALQQFEKGLFAAPASATTYPQAMFGWMKGFAGSFGLLTESSAASAAESDEERAAREAVEYYADKQALAKRVKRIETDFGKLQNLRVGDAVQITALPLDERAAAVHGITPEWITSDKEILAVKHGVQAVALRRGTAKLTVAAGSAVETVTVKIKAADEKDTPISKNAADKKDAADDARNAAVKLDTNSVTNSDKNTAEGRAKESGTAATVLSSNLSKLSSAKNAMTARIMPELEPDRPILTSDQLPSVFEPENNLGAPPNKTEPGAASFAAAARTRERPGASNFSFGIPVASLPGRGLSASVGISYNSRVWNKSSLFGSDNYTFNVDGNWLAPGFQMGYGYLDGYNYYGGTYVLTAPDGTRHSLQFLSYNGTTRENVFESRDGTFIELIVPANNVNPTAINVRYTDGTIVTFGAANNQGRRYPERITDRNGNVIRIAYKPGDGEGRIAYIIDTLERYIRFYYDSNNQLVTVTVPKHGSTTGEERQTIRFYYDDLTLQWQNRFDENAVVTAPTTALKVLKYVYFPGTGSGYKYEYSPYFGMVHKIWQLRGMQVSSSSTTETGTVDAASDNNWAAWTRYNYPAAAVELPVNRLTDVPKYTARTDDWQGRTTPDIALTSFEITEQVTNGIGTRTSKITTPDGTIMTSLSNVKPAGAWDNGLTTESTVTTPGRTLPWAKTKMFWSQGPTFSGYSIPRMDKTEVTNEAGQTSATTLGYDGYNNVVAVAEHDFAAPGTVGTELRRTVTSYQHNIGWTNRRLLRLPVSVRTIVGGVGVSQVDYEYDYGGPAHNPSLFVARDATVLGATFDRSFNPYESVRFCTIECDGPITAVEPDGSNTTEPVRCNINVERCCWRTCTPNTYDINNRFRGNVTKVTAYENAAPETPDPNAAKNIVNTFKYDITGNVVEAGLSCCRQKKWEFAAAHKYAYPTKTITGPNSELASEATYDSNSGAVLTSKDVNNQITSYTYNPVNLRSTRVDYPNGGYSTAEYGDGIIAWVKTKSKIDAFKESESWQFINGRGQGFRSRARTPEGQFLSSDAEFDTMGRPLRSFNPYTVATVDAARPAGIPETEVTEYDALGRTVSVDLQDGTTVSTVYNGTVTTATDQAGKKRRQIADALGRVVRVDEPDAGGALDNGTISSPKQPTVYEYDGNDNLTKVIQTAGSITQERVFVYDSLSRLTRERQPEMSPTLTNEGIKGPADPASKWTSVYKYNNYGHLTEGFDARGVKTAMTYDTLNRVKTVVYTGETGYQTPGVTYTYDEARNDAGGNPYFNKGRLTKVETAAVVATANQDTPATVQIFDYDKMGQVAKQVQQVGGYSYQLKYAYNLAGQLVAEEYPTGKVVRTAVDALGRTARVFDAKQNYVSGFQYNGNGTLASHFIGNGLQETFSFDPNRLQLTGQSLLKGTEVLQRYDYSYAPYTDIVEGQTDTNKNNGQLAKITSYIGGTVSNPTKQWEQRFAYDSVGRISETREYRGDVSSTLSYKQKFDYDRWGNLYRKAANNLTTGQEHPLAFTAIEESTNAAGDNGDINKKTNRFTPATGTVYDEAGSITKDAKFRGLDYFYDANNRMVKTRPVNTTVDSNSVYDALGQRVATKIGNEWRIMVYDAGGKMVCEYTSSQPVEEKSVQYVYSDRQGSTRVVTNASGTPISRNDYAAFGEEVSAGVGMRTTAQGYAGITPTRNKYALTERDEATGLDHTPWRKHEQKAGRWTSPDPYKGSMSLSDPQSFNRFTYTNNDPINYVDPSGLIRLADDYDSRWWEGLYSLWLGRQSGPMFMPMMSSDQGVGGGGPPSEEPPQEKKSDCGKVVDDLVSRTDGWKTNFAQHNTGRRMAYEAKNKFSKNSKDLPHDGFKWELVNNGQRGDVIKHIYGHAGVTIVGNAPSHGPLGGKTGHQISEDEMNIDISQANGADPNHSREEGETEIRNDLAGRQVGDAMKQRMMSKITRDDLRKKLFDILCEY